MPYRLSTDYPDARPSDQWGPAESLEALASLPKFPRMAFNRLQMEMTNSRDASRWETDGYEGTRHVLTKTD